MTSPRETLAGLLRDAEEIGIEMGNKASRGEAWSEDDYMLAIADHLLSKGVSLPRVPLAEGDDLLTRARKSMELPEMPPFERALRQMLRLRHGCPVGALYGDDGEMQCHACRADFMRDAPHEIENWLQRRAPVGRAPVAESGELNEAGLKRALQRLHGMRTMCSTTQDMGKVIRSYFIGARSGQGTQTQGGDQAATAPNKGDMGAASQANEPRSPVGPPAPPASGLHDRVEREVAWLEREVERGIIDSSALRAMAKSLRYALSQEGRPQ